MTADAPTPPDIATTVDRSFADDADTSLQALQSRAAEAAALLKALSNADRLLLMCQLIGGERSVSHLGTSTGIQQPSLSQQLGVLRSERLVSTRREGKHVVYRVASPAAMAILQTLYALFCAPAATAHPSVHSRP